MATEELDSIKERHRQEVETEIAKLQPSVDKYEELTAYRDAAFGATPRARRSTRRASGSPRASGDSDDGSRAEEFFNFVKENPGATIPDAARALDVSANYLYRVRSRLEEANRIRKEGQQHFVVEQRTTSGSRATPVAA